MKYVDIHCHLDFPDYDLDREEVLARMKENQVEAITIGVDFETSKKAVEIAKQNENVWACVGQHPKNMGDGFDDGIRGLTKEPKVIAIGECGLDYFRLEEGGGEIKKSQKKLFKSQIDLALEAGKPLMLHIRPSDKISHDAYFDSLEILEEYNKIHGSKLKGNVHFYVGNTEIMKRFLSLGFTFSFGGATTFTHEYDEVIKYIPIDSIMSETDAPFVAPVPYRGKRNEPVYVTQVVKKLAEIRGEDVDILREATVKNFQRVFVV